MNHTSDGGIPSRCGRDLLEKAGGCATVTYEEIDAPYGHDTFLIEHRRLGAMLKSHLEG